MDSQLMVLFAIAFTCAVAVPGPNVAFVVAQTIKYGHKIMVPCLLGFGLATLIHAVIALSGVGLLIHEHSSLLGYLRFVGAIYLTYLGLVSLLHQPEHHSTEIIYSIPRKAFIDSSLVALTNPKGWLATLLTYPSFISPYYSYTHQAIALILMGLFISLVIYGGYALLAQRARALLRNERNIIRFAGAIYLLVAIFLFIY
ncbi:LysE family translocator [Xanthomonas vasicola]|uniref:LysE family translocator n=1 Tax=Xanthomonas vasicola TaxID=56459 RepID=A0ABD7S7A5_XANVA|nr:LysE family translocator [Xanthomonas vasicola]AZR22126.1 LysE family translocator [Xanthomonas vasicola]KGR39397.1 amino acid permease [Xanthomonas vasicola]KGR41650.1 amino acid permease [Xanthomonas vasicola]KGR60289.1 amino acid permease [Xanthomonas vasicola]MDO6985817.1 LysE family translocator [Xanthomonas vasicola]